MQKECEHNNLDNTKLYLSNPPQKKCPDCGKFVMVGGYRKAILGKKND